MNKLYAQIPSSNPPHVLGVYPTDKGEQKFDPSTSKWENENPNWWMQEVSLNPVSPKPAARYKNNWEHWFLTRDENGKIRWF